MTDEQPLADSPLREATPDSVDHLLDEMNQAMVAGMPERITDEKLIQLINAYRTQAEHWQTADAEKRASGNGRKRKPTVEGLDLSGLLGN